MVDADGGDVCIAVNLLHILLASREDAFILRELVLPSGGVDRDIVDFVVFSQILHYFSLDCKTHASARKDRK